MRSLSLRWTRMLLWTGLLVGSVGLTACGGEEDRDPCAGVTCDFGVCDSDSGECTNEDSCSEEADCIPGYRCEEGSCAAQTECSEDGDCEAGVCNDDGACVNPDTCEENSECLERTYCEPGGEDSEGSCEPDPCNAVTCPHGVCERGTGECISEESCTPATEDADCVPGERCATPEGSEEGTCETPDSFCDDYTCERGVCTYGAGGCTNAADCEGDDANCLEGMFCDETNRCRPNLCVQQAIECEEGGQCDPATGECINAGSCESNADCVNTPSHLCVDNECTLEASACGDASGEGGCPGNQTCEYDSDELTTSCQEPDTCETSLDCTDDRRCAGRNCQAPQECSEDEFEPNDSSSEATNFHEFADQNTLSASACPDDTDLYTIATDQLSAPGETGTLVVELDVPDRERGLGSLDLTVTEQESGDEVGSISTGARGAEGHVEVTKELMVSDLGNYTIEVSAGDDMTTDGVDYELSANLLETDGVQACRDAETIPTQNSRISGTTEGASSTALGSTCTSADNDSPEKIYKFELDAPQEIDIDLEPELSSSDLSMSLRKNCTAPASEVACSDEETEGGAESITWVLGEGTYYLIVQAPAGEDAADGGAFELTIDKVFTACSSEDDYCDSDGNANVCTGDGGRFNEIECDAGCNASTGDCIPPEGDTCGDAPTIDPDNTDNRQVSLNQSTNAYDSDGLDCDDGSASRTGGPDQTFEVTVPPRTAFTADVMFQDEVEGSAYLVEDCSNLGDSCLAGAEDSVEDDDYSETLTYSNLAEESEDSDNSETLYLVVDTAADQSVTTAEVQVTYEEVVCTPENLSCSSADEVQECKEYGTGFNTQNSCYAGCTDGSCDSNCPNPRNVTSQIQDGATFDEEWDNYDASQNGTGCGVDDTDATDGDDAVWAVDLQADEVLTADITDSTGGTYESVFITSDCTLSESSCLDGEFDTGSVSATHYAETAQTVYIIVEADWESTGGDTFTLEAEIQSPQCDPSGSTYPQCSDSTTREYCTDNHLTAQEACDPDLGDCSSGECTCNAVTNITSDASQSSGFSLSGESWDDYSADQDGTGCGVPTGYTAGPDEVWAVDLADGEELTAELDSETGFLTSWDSLFISTDCSLSSSTCQAGEHQDGSSAVPISASYTNNTGSQETVYVFIDNDGYDGARGDTFDLDVTIQ